MMLKSLAVMCNSLRLLLLLLLVCLQVERLLKASPALPSQ
jgi:hypothetical protein